MARTTGLSFVRGKKSRPKKPTTTVRKKAKTIIVVMPAAAEKPSCRSEEERQDEELREETRSAVRKIEKAWQNNLAVQRENVERQEEPKLETVSLDGKASADRESEKLERTEKEHVKGRQYDPREKIDNKSVEQMQRTAIEPSGNEEKAGRGKTFTEHALRKLKQRQAIGRAEGCRDPETKETGRAADGDRPRSRRRALRSAAAKALLVMIVGFHGLKS